MKHTPGPWVVEPLHAGKKYYGTIVALPTGGLIEVWTEGTPTRTWTASRREKDNGWVPDYGADHVESEEDCANARLIAAAPEMYEELTAVLFALERSIPSAVQTIANIKAVIAKIEGE